MAINGLADALWLARRQGGKVVAPADLGGLEAAYALQDALIERAGERLIGWKVGATNSKAQAAMGIDGPLAGPLWESWAWHAPAEAEPLRVRLGEPGPTMAEVELAFLLGADGRLDGLMVSIELLGQRWATMPEPRAHGIIADHAANAGVALSAPSRDWDSLDLTALATTLAHKGKVVASGTSGLVLGDPRRSVAWLAEHAEARGRPLRAGEIVSSGAIIGPVALDHGKHYTASIEGVGTLDLIIEG